MNKIIKVEKTNGKIYEKMSVWTKEMKDKRKLLANWKMNEIHTENEENSRRINMNSKWMKYWLGGSSWNSD